MKKRKTQKKEAKIKNRRDYQVQYAQKVQKQFLNLSVGNIKELLAQHSLYFNKELFNPENRIKQAGKIRFKEMPLKLRILSETKWPIYYSSRVCQLLQNKNIDEQFLKMFFTDVMILADGIFCPQIATQQNHGYVKQIKIQEKSFSRFFLSRFHPNFSLIVKFCVQKFPIMTQDLKIIQQQYKDVLVVCDIIKNAVAQQIKKIKDCIKHYEDKESIFRFHEKNQLRTVEEANNKKNLFVHINPNMNKIGHCDTLETKLPNEIAFFEPLVYQSRNVQKLQANRWSYQPQQNQWAYQKVVYQIGKTKQTEEIMSQQVIDRLVDFEKIHEVIKVLSKNKEEFKVSLTDQEKQVIELSGNILVIGRSGTGKTTCSLLRLFCIDVIFKRNLQIYLAKTMQKSDNPEKIDINIKYKVRPVFLTASFFLAEEVKRYYTELRKIIAKHIENKKSLKYQVKLSQWEVAIKQQRDKPIIKGQDTYAANIEDQQDKMGKYKSLWDLQNDQFPLFLNVQRFIELIDGTLQYPFLTNTKKQGNNNSNSKGIKVENYRRQKRQQNDSESEQQEQLKFNINIEYVDDEIQEKYAKYEKKTKQQEKQQKIRRQNRERRNIQRRRLQYKVTYDYFYNVFWPQLYDLTKGNPKLIPVTIWTQIYSSIKGDANAYLYPQRYLPLQVYLETHNNMFLDTSDKKTIYHIFQLYEKIKKQYRCYDLLDLTNYILDNFEKNGYQGPQLHYLMIDEIQDLPQAMIYLLSKIFIKGLFYSGDTAQAITKGVSFQFSQIMKIFDKRTVKYPLNLSIPTKKQLTVSFRSQKKILRLANSLVFTIEQLFPKTIDQLKKEQSDFSGPIPMIIKNRDQDILDFILNGNQRKINRTSGDRPNVQFGCEQLIIVRNQKMKRLIPKSLTSALCLTIQQSKGLEFDDVVLYDFFKTSPCLSQWKIFKHVILPESQQLQDQKLIQFDSKAYGEDLSTYSQLCSQLKMLYTIITRARNIFVIYDEIAPQIRFLQEAWMKLGLIKVIEKYSDYQIEENEGQIVRTIIDPQKHKQRWQRQGLKMYVRGIYEQAIKCFEKCDNQQMLIQSQAYMLANRAQIELQKANFALINITKNKKYQEVYELQQKKQSALKNFRIAGQKFQMLRKHKHAGQCFYSGQSYQKAYNNFLQADLFYQVAQCLFQLNRFAEAHRYYIRANSYFQAINALLQGKSYEKALQQLRRYVQHITLEQRNYILKKCSEPIFKPIVDRIEHQALFNQESFMGKHFSFKKRIIEEKPVEKLLLQLQDSDSQLQYEIQESQEDKFQSLADDCSSILGLEVDQFSQFSSFIIQTRDQIKFDKSRSYVYNNCHVFESRIPEYEKLSIQRQIKNRVLLFKPFLKVNSLNSRAQLTEILQQLNLPKIVLFLCDIQDNVQDALKYFFMCTLSCSFAITQRNTLCSETFKKIQFLKSEQESKIIQNKIKSVKCLVDSLDLTLLSEPNMQFPHHIRAETLVNALFLQGLWHILPQYLNNQDLVKYYYTFMKYQDLSYLVQNQFSRNTFYNNQNLRYYIKPKTQYENFVNLISVQQTLLEFDKIGSSFFLSKKQKPKESYIHIILTKQEENTIYEIASAQIKELLLEACQAKQEIKAINNKKHFIQKKFNQEQDKIIELLQKDRNNLQKHFNVEPNKSTNHYYAKLNSQILNQRRQFQREKIQYAARKNKLYQKKRLIIDQTQAVQNERQTLWNNGQQDMARTLSNKIYHLQKQITDLDQEIEDVEAQQQVWQLKAKKKLPGINTSLLLLKPFYDHYKMLQKSKEKNMAQINQLDHLIQQQRRIIVKNDDKQYLEKQHKKIINRLTKQKKMDKQKNEQEDQRKKMKKFRQAFKVPQKPFIYLTSLLKHNQHEYLAREFQEMQKKTTGKDILLDQKIGDHVIIDFLGFLIYTVHNEDLLLEIVVDNPYILLNSFKSLYMIVSRIYNQRAYQVLKVLLSLYSCRFLTDCNDFLNIIGEEYILVSANSLISQKLFDKMNSQFNSTFKAYMIDPEGDLILTKSSYVIEVIKQNFFDKLVTVYNFSVKKQKLDKQVSQQILLKKISQFLEQGLEKRVKNSEGILYFTDPNYYKLKTIEENTIKILQMTWLKKGKKAITWNSQFYEKLLRQYYLKFNIEWDQRIMNTIAVLRDFILDCLFSKSIKANYNFIVLFQQLQKLQNLKQNLIKCAKSSNGEISIGQEKRIKEEIENIKNVLEVWKEKYEFIERFSKNVKGIKIDKKQIEWHRRN